MKLKLPNFDEEKVILPLVVAMVSIAYLYFIYIFRPSNSIAFPNVENLMQTALLILIIASVLAYIREILGLLKFIIGGPANWLLSKTMRQTSRLQALIANQVHPALKHHASQMASRIPRIDLVKAWAPVSDFARSVIMNIWEMASKILWGIVSKISKTASRAEAYIKKRFSRGKPYYFATLGLAAFLILSPLVIYNQKELAEPAVVIFVAYIAISFWKKLDDRVMIVSALLFLLSCPVLIIMKENPRAELAAIYAYYSLCAGVILQFVDYLQNRKKYEREEADADSDGKADTSGSQVQEIEKGCFRIKLPLGMK